MADDINVWNERIIAEFRANGGFVRWSDADDLAAGRPVPPRLEAFEDHHGVPMILLHHTGSRTGRERINPLLYQPVDGGFAVFATSGGSPRDPAWYRNLMTYPHTTVETGPETVTVAARYAERGERSRIWQHQIAVTPAFAEFEFNAGRRIPVVVLERV